MTFTKLACALLLTTGLAAPVWAAPGDAGSGPTTGATATNDSGSGPTNGVATMNKSSNGQNTTNGQNMTSGQSWMNKHNETNGDMTAGPGGMRVSQKLRNDLSKAGFTDIKIMPQSFMVRAKDSQGNPVMMVINPDSVTAITEQTESTNSASNSTHGATGNTGANNTNNSAGATPGPGSTGGSQPVTPGGATKP